ncbi:uncharacterized protein I206_103722 [Kwoniella pini CBS 10737]|uniref:RNA polymerase II subunit B1 CTD phosphatase RPAP2 homolog n=1 Tax=Kwoniella pini CBS 10737 TaxID=1296096 RepID=A0A1B9I936_9TREE|nr:uncharacterized protein I206_01277 [Kwoniella pini CBS 10737]OCF51993.1 hypothetical protein I206_01277 [Kwoniella pini CBS 10737]
MSNSSKINARAGPSNPVSRNPVRLAVAQRHSVIDASANASGRAAPAGENKIIVQKEPTDNDTLLRASVRKAQLQRRVDRWIDKLMEETVDRPTFKKVTAHLTPSQYNEITHERHLNSICSYSLCSNAPKREYSTARRFKISTTNRTIKEKEGNPEDGYCSKKCTIRSNWVEKNLKDEAIWLRSQIEEFDLLEELEERGEFNWNTPEGNSNLQKRQKIQSPSPKPITETNDNKSSNHEIPFDVPVQSGGSQIPNRNKSSDTPDSSKAVIPSQPENPISNLIANLTIYEHPIPSTPPIAPSLTKSSIAQSPTSTISKPNQAQNKSIEPSTKVITIPGQSDLASPKDARRAQSSLIGSGTSGLSNTFVNASKPLAHLAQDDSDVEEEREESDWEKEMGWGEDDEEMRGFWEEARLAREIAEDGEK